MNLNLASVAGGLTLYKSLSIRFHYLTDVVNFTSQKFPKWQFMDGINHPPIVSLWLGFPKKMQVSKHGGIPHITTLIRFSIINHPFWGSPILGNPNISPTIVDSPPWKKNPSSYWKWPSEVCWFTHSKMMFSLFNQWEWLRIQKWRYVSTIFQAIFHGDIPLHRPEK